MKILLTILTILTFLNAKTVIATYKVGFGIFGKIGTAQAILHIDNNEHYTVSIEAKATGFAKVLSGGRVEEYKSEGRVVNGVLVPDKYVGITKTSSKIRKKLYIFNHKAKKIKMIKITTKDAKTTKSQEYIKYYAVDDILSLFFNIKKYLDNFKFKGKKILYAVGANKKDGRVDLIVPTGKSLKDLKSNLGRKDGHFLKVFINQKIFASKRGELFLDIDNEGFCAKALLKDVILFGDITGELISLKVKNN